MIQRFNVPVEYTVYFTRNVLNPSNSCLEKAICHRNTQSVRRVFAILDGGLAGAVPDLSNELLQYFETRKKTIGLAGPILIVPGGEKLKNTNYWYSDGSARTSQVSY